MIRTRTAGLAMALTVGLCVAAMGIVQAQSADKRLDVDIDKYIASQQPIQKGSRTILPPQFIAFSAVVKSHPETIKVRYLYTALSMMKVDPLPAVSHRMFLETAAGKIFPVYVEDNVVAAIRSNAAVDSRAAFKGYRAYNYSKGPAIVINGVTSP